MSFNFQTIYRLKQGILPEKLNDSSKVILFCFLSSLLIISDMQVILLLIDPILITLMCVVLPA